MSTVVLEIIVDNHDTNIALRSSRKYPTRTNLPYSTTTTTCWRMVGPPGSVCHRMDGSKSLVLRTNISLTIFPVKVSEDGWTPWMDGPPVHLS